MSDENNRRPTHRAYAVTRGEQKNFWREIGAAWAHADGDGMTLVLDYWPLNGAELVIRKPQPADNGKAEIEQTASEKSEAIGKGRSAKRIARRGAPDEQPSFG